MTPSRTITHLRGLQNLFDNFLDFVQRMIGQRFIHLSHDGIRHLLVKLLTQAAQCCRIGNDDKTLERAFVYTFVQYIGQIGRKALLCQCVPVRILNGGPVRGRTIIETARTVRRLLSSWRIVLCLLRDDDKKGVLSVRLVAQEQGLFAVGHQYPCVFA